MLVSALKKKKEERKQKGAGGEKKVKQLKKKENKKNKKKIGKRRKIPNYINSVGFYDTRPDEMHPRILVPSHSPS